MKKFQERNQKKEELLRNIEEKLFGNKKSNGVGYEELVTMLMYCSVNNIDVDEDRNYEYLYEAVGKIHNEYPSYVPSKISKMLGLLRQRKNKLEIQDFLKEITGRPIAEQVILISKKIN